jgi:hypothetical protein
VTQNHYIEKLLDFPLEFIYDYFIDDVKEEFCHAIREYFEMDTLTMDNLIAFPFCLSCYFRLNCGMDDAGEPIECESCNKNTLGQLEFGYYPCATGYLYNNFCDEKLFGGSIYDTELANRIEKIFIHLISEPGAVHEEMHHLVKYEKLSYA